MLEQMHGRTAVRGRIRFYSVLPAKANNWARNTTINGSKLPGLWTPKTEFKKNAVMYDWATIAGILLQTGNSAYKINGMYLEYQNVANAADPVTPPVFDRSDGVDYYNALSSSPDIDYVRVPVVAATLTSTDETLFPLGNLLSFFAQSQAATTTGVHGKDFSDTGISKIFGGALVAIPDVNDRTKDLVFSRFYVETAEQQAKLATSQIGLEWSIELQ